jgi:3-methyladenine DNA glycosylase/8-oxoguanine DNA glycosylase
MTQTDYQRARRHLMRVDPVLGSIIKQVGACGLPNIPNFPPFMALAEAIASQQLSVKAADTIFGRFCGLFPPDGIPDAPRLLQLDDQSIRSVGFSRSKVTFLRDLASHVVEQRLQLDTLHQREDHHVVEQLTAVKGIGPWTAEIFLMFRLKRPDVFPADDLGLVKAAQNIYRLRQRPSKQRLLKMADAWRPYRSVAAWYLWRSLSLGASPQNARENKGKRRKAEGKRRTAVVTQ